MDNHTAPLRMPILGLCGARVLVINAVNVVVNALMCGTRNDTGSTGQLTQRHLYMDETMRQTLGQQTKAEPDCKGFRKTGRDRTLRETNNAIPSTPAGWIEQHTGQG